MMSNFGDFVKWEALTIDTVDFKRIYVDMTNGSLLAGLLLSQIVFWHLPNPSGKTKLRVNKKGHFWIAKSTEDWKKELRFSRSNLETVLKKLIDLELIEMKIFKFDGAPTKHIRLIEENFLKAWEDAVKQSEYKDELLCPIMNTQEMNKSNCILSEIGFVETSQNYNIEDFKDNHKEKIQEEEEEEENGIERFSHFRKVIQFFEQHNHGLQQLTEIQILYLKKMCEYRLDPSIAYDLLNEIGDLNQYHIKALEEALLKTYNRLVTGAITTNPIAWFKKVLKSKNIIYNYQHPDDDPFTKDYT